MEPQSRGRSSARVDGEEEAEHPVTPLELFFDLVFVFALTQVTGFMSDDPSWAGVGRGMLILAALWWAWGAYAWLTNEIDPNEGSARLAVFGSMAAMFVAALAVPHAFDSDAVLFGLAYFAVRLMHIVLFAEATPHVDVRQATFRLARTAIPGPGAAHRRRLPRRLAPRSLSGSWPSRSTTRAPMSSASAASRSRPTTSPSATG